MIELFVGCVPFGADEAFVRHLFSPYGEVVAVELHADWVTPTNEPHAYVQIRTSDPEHAVNALDGKKLGQNHLRVHRRVRALGASHES